MPRFKFNAKQPLLLYFMLILPQSLLFVLLVVPEVQIVLASLPSTDSWRSVKVTGHGEYELNREWMNDIALQ